MTTNKTTPVDAGTYDFVILGGGAAGCVLANRLSADPNNKVLLLEAGGRKLPIWVHIPLGMAKTIGDPRVDWCLQTEPEPQLNNRQLPIPRGRGLGGSTLINGMVYIRGQKQDYDRWRDLGNPGWGWDDVLPIFKQHEDFQDGSNEHHGAGGEWRVEDVGTRWEILDRFTEAAAKLGYPTVPDVNVTGEGFSYIDANTRSGVRVQARGSFLDPVMNRPNLHVVSEARANRVLMQGRRATGVEYWRGDRLHRATARAEVIVSCGAIGSPALLQASGIGNPELLQSHGIAVAHALPGVGENLQDHLMTRTYVRVADGVETVNARASSFLGRAGIGMEYMLHRTGPLAASSPKICGFVRSSSEYATPNVQYHISAMSSAKFAGDVHPWPGITIAPCNLRPSSRGHVRIRSADARENPAISPNFLSTEEDRRIHIDMVRLTRRILATEPMKQYVREEVEPGLAVDTDDAILAYVRQTAMTVFHPAGTCKMGHDEMAVVDARLRVHGIAGLRVVDASIMPTLPSGNTSAPSLMVAEKGAALILADLRRGVAV